MSEVGNFICSSLPEIDFTISFNMGSRTIEMRATKDNIDLGKIATELGGGGHPKAAGAPFNDKIRNMLHRYIDDTIV